MTELLILAGVIAATAALSLWWRVRDGQVRAVDDRFSAAELAALDAPARHRLLVEFTAPSCAPCAAARRVLDEVAADHADVAVRTLDVGERADLARRHKVLRAPTTFVVAADGTVRGRVAGVPDRTAVARLLDKASANRERAA